MGEYADIQLTIYDLELEHEPTVLAMLSRAFNDPLDRLEEFEAVEVEVPELLGIRPAWRIELRTGDDYKMSFSEEKVPTFLEMLGVDYEYTVNHHDGTYRRRGWKHPDDGFYVTWEGDLYEGGPVMPDSLIKSIMQFLEEVGVNHVPAPAIDLQTWEATVRQARTLYRNALRALCVGWPHDDE